MKIIPVFKPLMLSMIVSLASTAAHASIECSELFGLTSEGPSSLLRDHLSNQLTYADAFAARAEANRVIAIISSQAAGDGEIFSRRLNIALTDSTLRNVGYIDKLLQGAREVARGILMTSSQDKTIADGITAAITMNPYAKTYLEKYAQVLWGTTLESKVAESNLRNHLDNQLTYADAFAARAEADKVIAIIVSEAAGSGEVFSRLINIALTDSTLRNVGYLVDLLNKGREIAQSIPMTSFQNKTIADGVTAAITMTPYSKGYLDKYAQLLWGTTLESKVAESNLRNHLDSQLTYADAFSARAEADKVSAIIASEAAGNGEVFSRLLNIALTDSTLRNVGYLVDLLQKSREIAQSIQMTSAQNKTVADGIVATITMNPYSKSYLDKYSIMIWGR